MFKSRKIRVLLFTMLALLLGAMPVQAANEASTTTDMSKGLWEAFSDAQHQIDPAGQSDDTYKAQNPKNQLVFGFGEEGFTVKPGTPDQDWTLTMKLAAFGQADRLAPVTPAQLRTLGRRIEFVRGPLTEWYQNDSKGLEQGFTIQKPEHYDASKPVVLSLDLTGNLVASLDGETDALFTLPDGSHAFDYRGLKAFDATGSDLPARLVLADKKLDIHVEVGDKAWPITVDPIVTTQTKLLPETDDSAPDDYFGYSVSIESDMAIIGAHRDDDGGTDSGSAYVFTGSGATWRFEAKLTASDAATNDHFGWSSSIDRIYDVVLIGAPGGEAAYLFERTDGLWSEIAKLSSAAGTLGARFGQAVALESTWAVVGAPYEDTEGTDSGAAWVFIKPTNWTTSMSPDQNLASIPGAVTSGDNFGTSMHAYGKLVVGAPGDDDSYTDSGSAFIFRKSGSTFVLDGTLTAGADAVSNNFFGSDVSMSTASRAIVGALGQNGSAHVFKDESGSWTKSQKLTAFDGSAGDAFGSAVSASNIDLVIGAPFSDVAGADSGSAYVYKYESGSYIVKAKLTPSDGAAGAKFGSALITNKGMIIAGTGHDEGDADDASGLSAYFYLEPVGGWSGYQTETFQFAAVNTQTGQEFGYTLALSGDTAVVGDPKSDSQKGKAHVFRRVDGIWGRQAMLTASDGVTLDEFGTSVAIDDDTVVIGAPKANSLVGAAYIFVEPAGGWTDMFEVVRVEASDSNQSTLFGQSVSISEDTAAIGASGDGAYNGGTVYVFDKPGSGGWASASNETGYLQAAGTFTGRELGFSVSISGDTIVAGSPGFGEEGVGAGTAYIFVEPGGGWGPGVQNRTAKLSVTDSAALKHLGYSVAISGDTAIIGTYPTKGSDTSIRGAAYIFEKPDGGWADMTETQKLLGFGVSWGDYFGRSVSIDGDTAIVGAYLDDDNAGDSGSAFLFVRGFDNWHESTKITAADATTDGQFGAAVSISGDTTGVGAMMEDHAGVADTGAVYINRFPCSFGNVIQGGRWTMIGLPCKATSSTIGAVLGDDLGNSSTYGSSWIVYTRDVTNNVYQALGWASPLYQGISYWIYSSEDAFWDVDGTLSNASSCALGKCIYIPLGEPTGGERGWNMVSNSTSTEVLWSSVGVRDYLLVEKDLETAVSEGLISSTIHKYNGNGYDAYNDVTPGMLGVLKPFEGVWVETFDFSPVELLIPVGKPLGGDVPEPPLALNKEPAQSSEAYSLFAWISDLVFPRAWAFSPFRQGEWYLRLTAVNRAEGLRDQGNVLGQLTEASDGYDLHDLEELSPFAGPYLTIVFPHHDWGDKAGNYSCDYHNPSGKESDQWVFQVKSDNPWREINLYWEDINMISSQWSFTNNNWTWTKDKTADGESLMARMWLQDLDSGEMIKASVDGVIQNYTFNMSGEKVRTFRWIKTGPGGKKPKVSKNRARSQDPDSQKEFKGLPDHAMGQPPRLGHGQK